MNKIEIEIPEGKRAEWVNGVLTLVDDKPQDITDRIKTFEDAYRWCEDNAEVNLVNQYDDWEIYNDSSKDVVAYLKLRIITAALNEGWEPTYAEGECRWSVEYGTEFKNFDNGFSYDIHPYYDPAPIKLIYKSETLVRYAVKQFVDIYADLFGCKEGGEG